MLKLSTTAFKRVYFGLLERFYGVDANPRISLYARIFISPINHSTNLKLPPFNSARVESVKCVIQKLRVKCSVTYFYIRSLAFSFVSYYTTHSPIFYKGLRFLERFYGVRANPRISLYARIVISPINHSTNLKLLPFNSARVESSLWSLEPFSVVSENPRRSIYARIFFALKRTLLTSNSTPLIVSIRD